MNRFAKFKPHAIHSINLLYNCRSNLACAGSQKFFEQAILAVNVISYREPIQKKSHVFLSKRVKQKTFF